MLSSHAFVDSIRILSSLKPVMLSVITGLKYGHSNDGIHELELQRLHAEERIDGNDHGQMQHEAVGNDVLEHHSRERDSRLFPVDSLCFSLPSCYVGADVGMDDGEVDVSTDWWEDGIVKSCDVLVVTFGVFIVEVWIEACDVWEAANHFIHWIFIMDELMTSGFTDATQESRR